MAERDGEMVFRDAMGFLGGADGERARCVLVKIGTADTAPVDVYCHLGKEIRSGKIIRQRQDRR